MLELVLCERALRLRAIDQRVMERSLPEQFHHIGLSRGILNAGAGPLRDYVSRVGAEWEARVRSSSELSKAHAGLVRTALAA